MGWGIRIKWLCMKKIIFFHLNNSVEALTYTLEKNGFLKPEGSAIGGALRQLRQRITLSPGDTGR